MCSKSSPPATACSVTELGLDLVAIGELLAVVEPLDPGCGLGSSVLLRKSIGGSEVNVALTLARLGHRVGWAGAVGDDPFGHEGVRTLRGAGVDVSRVVLDGSAPTGVYFKEIHPFGGLDNYAYRAGSAASKVSIHDIDTDYVCSGRVLHLTGISALISSSGYELVSFLVDLARRRNVHISVDPNVRLRLLRGRAAPEVLAPLIQGADTLLLSSPEAFLLLSTDDPEAIQDRLGTLRATTVVVHDQRGATAITAEQIVRVEARPVGVLDPTGAGDAFASGYLSGWLDGTPLDERLRRAELCAALTVASRGDNPVDLPGTVRPSGPVPQQRPDDQGDRR